METIVGQEFLQNNTKWIRLSSRDNDLYSAWKGIIMDGISRRGFEQTSAHRIVLVASDYLLSP